MAEGVADNGSGSLAEGWGMGESTMSARGLFSDEPRLLEAFTLGEPRALSEVYLRCRGAARRLIAYGFRLRGQGARYVSGVSQSWQIDEILQEAFTRAFSASGRRGYDATKPYLPYLLQIVRHTRIDSLRSSWRYVPSSGSVIVDGSAGGAIVQTGDEPAALGRYDFASSTPEEELDRTRESRALRSCLALLDQQSRDFVTLRYFEELSQNDTALAMGIGRRRVRTMERRVLGTFQRCCRSNVRTPG